MYSLYDAQIVWMRTPRFTRLYIRFVSRYMARLTLPRLDKYSLWSDGMRLKTGKNAKNHTNCFWVTCISRPKTTACCYFCDYALTMCHNSIERRRRLWPSIYTPTHALCPLCNVSHEPEIIKRHHRIHFGQSITKRPPVQIKHT